MTSFLSIFPHSLSSSSASTVSVWNHRWRKSVKSLLTVILSLSLVLPFPVTNAKLFTNHFAVHIADGSADEIATKHGFVNLGQIFDDVYHFSHPQIAKRSLEPHQEFQELLNAEEQVKWHKQQRLKRRIKRDYVKMPEKRAFNGSSTSDRKRLGKRSRIMSFNDPRWPVMWYLNRGAGLDMNVVEAWNEGITGKGIVVTILDDGLEKDHPDIRRNYDPMASFDVNSVDMDPMPTYDLTDSNRHGTRCAGEVAAEANNSLCAVGVAFEASVGGVRMLDGDVTDAVEARSLSHNPQHIDIYSASWGPDDDGKTVDGPGELATRAFVEGVTKGRGGKGSIFVWASGNGGRDHDNCNCDGYTNSIWTLSISSATENGLVPWYSEACSSTLATTYSSGGTGEKQIVTIDLHHSCTSSHTGTSASAPLAAGICALALQANTNLTWRDMQHIVVRTARPQNLIASDWATNGVGRNVSHSFGYGLMDAGAMVKLARVWKTVPEQNKCEIRAPQIEKNIPPKSKVTLDLKVTNCPGVNFLEHVQAKVTLTSQRRGDLQIYLVSPSGTRSTLLAHRRYDMNRAGFTDWPFMTVHSWGENPIGKWTLEIHNEGRFADRKLGRTVLKRWSLIAYGTETDSNSPESPSPANGNYNREGSSSSPSPPIRYPAVINLSYLNNKTSPAYYTPRNKVGGRKDGVVDFSNSTLHNFQSQGGAAAVAESRNVSLGVGGQTDGPGPGIGSGGSGNGQKGGKNNTRQGFKARLKLHSKKQKGASPPPSGSQSEESQESQRPHTRLVTEAPSGGGGAAAPESIDSNQAENKLAERAKFSNQSVITGSKYSKEKALNSSKEATQIQHTNPTNVGRDTETRKKSQGKGNDKLESVKDVAAGDSGMGEMNGKSIAKLSSAHTVTHSGQGLERASESRQLPNATTREVNAADANSFTSTSEDSRDGTQSRDNLQGKLQTWTLVAHGIESNPNGNGNKSSEASGTGSVVGANASGSSGEGERQPVDSAKDVENVESATGIGKEADLAKASHGGGEFDGGDNGIAMPPKQVASLPLGVESALPTDLSSASSSATSAFCAKMSVNGQCLDCLPSHVLFRGVCIQSCPETFFKEISRGSGETSDGRSGSLRGNDSNISFICLPCHYTCKTCSGPNSFECLTCHSDSSLHVQNSGAGNAVTEYHCYPAVILEKLNSNALSYQVLMVSFLACMIVVALLAIYVVCSRRESPLGQPRSVFQRQSYYRVSPDEDSLNSHSSVVQDVESEESDEEVSYVKPLTAIGKGAHGHSATRNGPDATYMARNANTFVAVPKPDFVIAKNDSRNAIFDEKLQSVL